MDFSVVVPWCRAPCGRKLLSLVFDLGAGRRLLTAGSALIAQAAPPTQPNAAAGRPLPTHRYKLRALRALISPRMTAIACDPDRIYFCLTSASRQATRSLSVQLQKQLLLAYARGHSLEAEGDLCTGTVFGWPGVSCRSVKTVCRLADDCCCLPPSADYR
jgi:hypothetical protein